MLRPETLALLDMRTAQKVDAVRACSFSPDERWMAAGGEAEVVELWDVSGLKVRGTGVECWA
jgi:WD40 repeat protein